MICSYRSLIGPWLDGAVQPEQAEKIAHHLPFCSQCQEEKEAIKALGHQIRAAQRCEPAPEGLRRQIEAALAAAAESRRDPKENLPRQLRYWTPAALAAGLAVWLIGAPIFSLNDLDHDLAGAHLAGLTASTGPVETPSDQLNPLLAVGGAVAPVPKDFTDHGFKLLGARRAQITGRPGSALIYQALTGNMSKTQAKGRLISLFIVRAQDPHDRKPVHHNAEGLNVIRWTDDGRDYAAVSDLDREVLDRFVKIACDEL